MVRQNRSHSNSSKEWDFPWWPEQYQALLTNWWSFIFCFHSCKVSKLNWWPNLDLIPKEFKVSECSLNDFASKWERFAKKVNPKELDQTLVWFQLKFESEFKLILWLGTKTKLWPQDNCIMRFRSKVGLNPNIPRFVWLMEHLSHSSEFF